MRNDQIFVLLLVILLPMSGCFDGAVGDAEGTDDASENGDVSGGEDTSTGTASSNQARTWYSSGGVYQPYWDDGQYSGYYLDDIYIGPNADWDTYGEDEGYANRNLNSNAVRCLDWGPYYNSSTGNYVGTECIEWGYPESESDWNLTDCTDDGGEIIWNDQYIEIYGDYRYAPQCMMAFSTINSTAGEALLIYEWSGFSMTSTCDGVAYSTSSYALSGKEYIIAPGTALECSHEVYQIRTYSSSESQSDTQTIWSIVYAIQDTTVV